MDEEFDKIDEIDEGLAEEEEQSAYALAMFRLMYPLVEVPTGHPCDKPDCCGGANMEMAVICSAVN